MSEPSVPYKSSNVPPNPAEIDAGEKGGMPQRARTVDASGTVSKAKRGRRAKNATAPQAGSIAPATGTAGTALSPAQQGLRKLGLIRDIDLALHLPLRYEDETRIIKLRDARHGETVQIEGVVTHQEIVRRQKRQLLVTLEDGSDTLRMRFFSFYPSHLKALAVGSRVRVRGEIKSAGIWGGWEMMHPAFRSAVGDLPASLTPVYPTVAGLPQGYLRKAVLGGLSRADLHETVPPDLQGLFPVLRAVPTLKTALQLLHQPGPDVPLATLEDHNHPAWQRLKFEELLAQQLAQLQARAARGRLRAPELLPHHQDDKPPLHIQMIEALPFEMTTAQHRVFEEILRDMRESVPMHRLLQGDVGSGKTVVAALAAGVAIGAGWQCALMVPTEILAQQHFRKLVEWLLPRGVQVAWLTGAQKKGERAQMLEAIASGAAGLVVGTHAVIQEQVHFHRLGLVIIDEQHRFGVAQRLALRDKLQQQELEPHFLMMSATPIPRTLAMSYYADLDVSTLDELPPGRTPVATRLFSEQRKEEIARRIGDLVAQGRQAYWVCPLIEESEALDLSNATATYEYLRKALPGVEIGVLHSRMPPAEKKDIMARFVAGQMSVLVSTTVIEVGVDVPNASLMVIEHAERFGLSQLHQLRGRVGRGNVASTCVLLFGEQLGQAGRERLKAMVETNDGFEIARRDLDIRGPGEFLGARQSGDALLRFANLAEDEALLDAARKMAPIMLREYPKAAVQHVQRWLGEKAEFLKA